MIEVKRERSFNTLLQTHLFNDVLDEKISEAERIISDFSGRNAWVSFSGGKDSVVLLDLVSRVFNRFKVVYASIPSNTHPICDEYVHSIIERYDCEFYHVSSHHDFWELFAKWGYPCRNRWCLGHFKDVPIRKVTGGKGVGFVGVRRDESSARLKRYSQREFVFKPTKTNSYKWVRIAVAPLLNWTSVDINAYISREKIPLNPLYRIVGWSCNCVFCPFLSSEKKREFFFNPVLSSFREMWIRCHEEITQKGNKGCEVVWEIWHEKYKKLKKGELR